MPKRPRRNHSPAFKSKVVLAGVKGDKTISELSQQLIFIRTRLRSGKHSCWSE